MAFCGDTKSCQSANAVTEALGDSDHASTISESFILSLLPTELIHTVLGTLDFRTLLKCKAVSQRIHYRSVPLTRLI